MEAQFWRKFIVMMVLNKYKCWSERVWLTQIKGVFGSSLFLAINDHIFLNFAVALSSMA